MRWWWGKVKIELISIFKFLQHVAFNENIIKWVKTTLKTIIPEAITDISVFSCFLMDSILNVHFLIWKNIRELLWELRNHPIVLEGNMSQPSWSLTLFHDKTFSRNHFRNSTTLSTFGLQKSSSSFYSCTLSNKSLFWVWINVAEHCGLVKQKNSKESIHL